jgi:P27 family predicted phage terminase small subunit
MAGRPPKPRALKLIAGDPKSRINFDEPQPEIAVPQCRSTDPLVGEIWQYAANALRQMNLLTIADRDLLLAYCQAVAAFERATKILAEEGMFLRIGQATVPHTALKVQNEQASIMKSLGAEFGFSPASRTRIKVADSKPAAGKDNTSARLLSG